MLISTRISLFLRNGSKIWENRMNPGGQPVIVRIAESREHLEQT